MILVDQPIWPAHGRRFAHLVSDTSFDELHRFAIGLGLPARAFHRDHYDLPDVWWADAVAAGATVVDSRDRPPPPGLRPAATRPVSRPDDRTPQGSRD